MENGSIGKFIQHIIFSTEMVVGFILLVIGGFSSLLYTHRRDVINFFKKIWLNLFPISFNVALSLSSQEGLNSGNYYLEIKKKLQKDIKDRGLSRHIKLKEFSDIQRFDNKDQAEQFRKKKDLDLIIWGSFSNDGLQRDGEHISLLDVYFTYSYIDDHKNRIGSMLLLDINSKLAIKNYWQIVEGNSLEDVNIVSNNLFDISTYILALTLKISGNIEISTNLFEVLYEALRVRKDSFSDHVVPHLLDCYRLIIIDSTTRKYRYDIGKEYCKKYLIIKPNDFFSLSNLAFFEYLTGEIKPSEEHVERLLALFPDSPITMVNVAFIRILQKKYKNAFRQYQKIIKKASVDFNPQQVVAFLDEQYQSKKDPALLYGAGIISVAYGDQVVGKDYLDQFLKLSEKSFCEEMYENANRVYTML